jgi:cytoskeletal protein CcmA (bactofilin family)
MGIFGKPPETKPEPPPPSRPVAASPTAAPTPAPARPAATTCVIGTKTTVKGELIGDEDILVEGTVEGQIKIQKDLRIGQGGTVKATVHAKSVLISGEMIGDCFAESRVEIQATGRLTGNITAPRVVIAEGAVFKGNSDMTVRKG